ncbi:hypothetical protein MA16_Dca022890 [Dendrobium catenatum]|uniref:Uncharacterized protein n=1 Tax=Dendrobium catenatum TaxID=906689 RepID=A0A2I0VCP0_9ASPA|nr:hypothetical protein MA16_Dca022890 [Dendrobium catenatum]
MNRKQGFRFAVEVGGGRWGRSRSSNGMGAGESRVWEKSFVREEIVNWASAWGASAQG